MRAITWLGFTVSPACATICDSTPSVGEETSKATLSVSISTRISSFFTASPTFLVQVATVPSVTLSPIVGTVTSISPSAGAGAGATAGAGAGGGAERGAAALPLALGAGAGLAGAAPSLTTPSRAPGVTVAPSSAVISLSVPSAGAATSRLTLSVSSSTSTSSFFTASPAFFDHLATVASLTLSPSWGVTISAMGSLEGEAWNAGADLRERLVQEGL